MIAFMSPIGAGWYDTPDDPKSQVYGADFAAQEEAMRIHALATFPCTDIAVAGLSSAAADSLAEALRRFCIFMCPEEGKNQ